MTDTPNAHPVAPGIKEMSTERGFYDAYAGFARTLRTWLIAFGVGAPIVFFRSPEAWEAMGTQGAVRPFVYCFLGGIGLQVVNALLYKTAMWYLYMNEIGQVEGKAWRYRASDWISTAYLLELTFDLLAIGLFSYATLRAIHVVVK